MTDTNKKSIHQVMEPNYNDPSGIFNERHQMNSKPVCAVFDKKIGLFDNPFICRHVGEAVREWTIVKKNEQTKYGKNPEDFDLFQVGYFNEQSGNVENITPHIHLDTGV